LAFLSKIKGQVTKKSVVLKMSAAVLSF